VQLLQLQVQVVCSLELSVVLLLEMASVLLRHQGKFQLGCQSVQSLLQVNFIKVFSGLCKLCRHFLSGGERWLVCGGLLMSFDGFDIEAGCVAFRRAAQSTAPRCNSRE